MKNFTLLLLVCSSIAFAQAPDWQWAKNSSLYFNGEKQSHIVDTDGNVVLAGTFNTATMTISGVTLTNNGPVGKSDVYIAKYTPDGTLLYAKSFGGADHENIFSITAGASGDFYMSGGFTFSVDFDGIMLTAPSGRNFLTRFNSEGVAQWARTNPVDSYKFAFGAIKTDAAGNLYMNGSMSMTVIIDGITAEYQFHDPDVMSYRPYVAKLDPSGTFI